MAIPCIPGLRPQRAWIVFSAPEITTVSKPNKNPASAEVMDQKMMRAFMRPVTPLRMIPSRCGVVIWRKRHGMASSGYFGKKITGAGGSECK